MIKLERSIVISVVAIHYSTNQSVKLPCRCAKMPNPAIWTNELDNKVYRTTQAIIVYLNSGPSLPVKKPSEGVKGTTCWHDLQSNSGASTNDDRNLTYWNILLWVGLTSTILKNISFSSAQKRQNWLQRFKNRPKLAVLSLSVIWNWLLLCPVPCLYSIVTCSQG